MKPSGLPISESDNEEDLDTFRETENTVTATVTEKPEGLARDNWTRESCSSEHHV